MSMSYRKSKGKIVICIDGAYISITEEQVNDLKAVIVDIESGGGKSYREDARRD